MTNLQVHRGMIIFTQLLPLHLEGAGIVGLHCEVKKNCVF